MASLTIAGRLRSWARSQQLLLLVFVAVALLLWVSGSQATLGATGQFLFSTSLYTLCCGNLALLLMPALFRRVRTYPPSRAWPLLIGSGLGLGALGSLAGAAILAMLGMGHFSPNFRGGSRIALVVTPVVVIVFYLYDISRTAMERRATELEKAVASGSDRLRMQDEEFQKAREIQQGLMPKDIAQVRGYQVAGTWQPALAVGGDYYDVLRFGDTSLGFVIADVVGKGISAALLMANLQAAVRAYASEFAEPRLVCEQINAVMCSNIAPGKFITFFYGVLDGAHRKLTYCNAGHNPPLLVRGVERAIKLDKGGALLGVFPQWTFEQETIDLLPGDRLALYTDGVTEAENTAGEEYGEERLEEMIRRYATSPAPELQARLLDSVTEFCGGNFRDDVTLLLVAVR